MPRGPPVHSAGHRSPVSGPADRNYKGELTNQPPCTPAGPFENHLLGSCRLPFLDIYLAVVGVAPAGFATLTTGFFAILLRAVSEVSGVVLLPLLLTDFRVEL